MTHDRPQPLRIALVAHDSHKPALCEWADRHRDTLVAHQLCATGTTGQRLIERVGLTVELLCSGPFGGDQQLGARIAEGTLDALVFFWDPLSPMAHEADVRALFRLATVWDIPVALNPASADLLIRSLDDRGPHPCTSEQDRDPALPAAA